MWHWCQLYLFLGKNLTRAQWHKRNNFQRGQNHFSWFFPAWNMLFAGKKKRSSAHFHTQLQLCAFCPKAIIYCYHEFKLRYLKKQKLFSIWVKELFEPTVLRKKRRWLFALFKSIFLRNRSLSNARWFYDKKCKIEKGNLYLTENRSSWNEMCCAADNHNYMCHTCAKEF